MEIKLLLKEKDKRIVVDNFRTGTLLAQGGAPRGPKGDQGVGVTGVELISVAGVNKTYRMHFSDSSYFDFIVKDGADGLWGYIGGELANQTDLASALNSKANVADLATVATTGNYEDLLNQPTIPTDTEDLTNGAGYQTASDVSSAITSGITGKANTDLSNVTKPYVVETSPKSILPSWWQVWSDGWCEQGGYSSANSVTFLKPMADTQYTLILTSYRNGSELSGDYRYITTYSTTGFTKALDSNESFWWEVKGYLPSED